MAKAPVKPKPKPKRKPRTKATPGPKPMYTLEWATAFCERLIEGESMITICKRRDMPSRATILRWLDEHREFEAIYARARQLQGLYMDDLIRDTAEQSTAATAIADRVKIDAYKWRAERLEPKRFGKSVQLNHRGAVGTFDATGYTDEQLNRLENALVPIALASGDAEGGEGGAGSTSD